LPHGFVGRCLRALLHGAMLAGRGTCRSHAALPHISNTGHCVLTPAGEVTRVVDRGTSAIQNVLSTIVFSIVPQIIDVVVASTYLAIYLDPLIAMIVFITIGSYIPLTVLVTECAPTPPAPVARGLLASHGVPPRNVQSIVGVPMLVILTPHSGDTGRSCTTLLATEEAHLTSCAIVHVLHHSPPRLLPHVQVEGQLPPRHEQHRQRQVGPRHRRAPQLGDRQVFWERVPRGEAVRHQYRPVPGR
jgi:hypothetical protein